MKKWLYFLGGCLTGFLVKMKADEHTKPGPVRDWPWLLKIDEGKSGPSDITNQVDDRDP